MPKYTKELSQYPEKILADGSISRMSRLPSGDIGRTRTYPSGRTEYSLNLKNGKKVRINGCRHPDGFFSPDYKKHADLLKKFFRENAPSRGCQRQIV